MAITLSTANDEDQGISDTQGMQLRARFNAIDLHVGTRVKMQRTILGISQERLGEHLGVTFQQIQKYEKGANRIGASRLYAISQILEVPVQFFFEDMPDAAEIANRTTAAKQDETDSAKGLSDFVRSPEGLALAVSFARIKDRATRKHLSDLVRSVAETAEA